MSNWYFVLTLLFFSIKVKVIQMTMPSSDLVRTTQDDKANLLMFDVLGGSSDYEGLKQRAPHTLA